VFIVDIIPNEPLKVSSLKPDLRNIHLIVKIVNISPSRTIASKRDNSQHLIADTLVGDENGSVVLTLWDDQISRFKPNEVIEIKGGYTTLFKGSLRLNIGRGKNIDKVDKKIDEVNTSNNLSEKTHINIPWHQSERRPFKRRRRR
jgi:replication factor A1